MERANDRRAEKLMERVRGFRKSCKKLQVDAAATVKHEIQCGKSYADLSNHFKNMSQIEQYNTLKISLQDISDSLSELESHRSHMIVGRIQQSMIEKTKELDLTCNGPTKLLLKDRNQSTKNASKYKDQFDSLASKNLSQEKMEKKKAQLKVEENRVLSIDKNLQQTMVKYEHKRISEAKSILDDFIKSQLFFHCRAVELLTKSYRALGKVNPDDAVVQMCKELRFNLHNLNPEEQN